MLISPVIRKNTIDTDFLRLLQQQTFVSFVVLIILLCIVGFLIGLLILSFSVQLLKLCVQQHRTEINDTVIAEDLKTVFSCLFHWIMSAISEKRIVCN